MKTSMCVTIIVAMFCAGMQAYGQPRDAASDAEILYPSLLANQPAGELGSPPALDDGERDDHRLSLVLQTNWYFHDTGSGSYGSDHWGQSASTPLVEGMDQTTPTGTGSNQVIMGSNIPYYAAAAKITTNYSATSFSAKLWLKNTTGTNNTVYVKLHRGTWNTDGSVSLNAQLASTSQAINSTSISEYTFSLGVPGSGVSAFNNESLIVEIYAATASLTKIYWDDSSYKSRLIGVPYFTGTIPDGVIHEAESDCYDEYDDAYNGGCNSDPATFQTLSPTPPGASQNVCGTSGTYIYQGGPARDTDWYEVVLTRERDLGFSVMADFPLQIVLIDGNYGCPDPPIIDIETAPPGELIGLTEYLAPGTYWLWVGPSVFEGVECGAEYCMNVTGNWTDPEPAVCCIGGYCEIMYEPECEAVGGIWYPYFDSCDPNPCWAVCCFTDGSCEILTEDECASGGGDWLPDWTSCDPNPCEPEDPRTWYFNDSGVIGWGQTYTDKWEWMDYGPLPDCIWQDLDVDNPYIACSPLLSRDYSGFRFYAKIYLANNYENESDLVTAELRRGSWGNEGTLLSSASVYCTTYMLGQPTAGYLFDFGMIDDLNLVNESLLVKIIYDGGPGNTHIYWDGEFCASALHAVGPGEPGPDTVMCEAQGADNPTHPMTYWYDVTPTGFGRCDFHVRVFDTDPANYANPSLPADTWQFAVHPVGDEWWASWWDPECQNAIFDHFRFQFDNTSTTVWGKWTTTIGASPNPYCDVIDFHGRHFAQADGYGYRVHVPSGLHTHYLDHDINECTLTMTDQGILGFMDDTQAQGSGFVYPEGGSNLLFVGSLWVGLDESYVANRDYTADPAIEWSVSATPDGRCWETDLGTSHQDIHAAFNDGGATVPVGLHVDQESWAWEYNSVLVDHVILNYTLTNQSGGSLDDVYVGCFMDFDIGDYQENTAGTEPSLNLAYVTDASDVHAGVMLLWSAPGDPPVANVTVVSNPDYVWPNGYMLDADKYGFLSAGGPQYVLPDAPTPDDYSTLVSAGPFHLDPGEEKRVSFAVLGGEGLDDLLLHAMGAQAVFTYGFADVDEDQVLETPRATSLLPSMPNPFTDRTTVRFTLSQESRVNVGVYDVNGRLVRMLARGTYAAQEHRMPWDGRDENGSPVSGGVYFLRMDTGRRQECQRVIRLR